MARRFAFHSHKSLPSLTTFAVSSRALCNDIWSFTFQTASLIPLSARVGRLRPVSAAYDGASSSILFEEAMAVRVTLFGLEWLSRFRCHSKAPLRPAQNRTNLILDHTPHMVRLSPNLLQRPGPTGPLGRVARPIPKGVADAAAVAAAAGHSSQAR